MSMGVVSCECGRLNENNMKPEVGMKVEEKGKTEKRVVVAKINSAVKKIQDGYTAFEEGETQFQNPGLDPESEEGQQWLKDHSARKAHASELIGVGISEANEAMAALRIIEKIEILRNALNDLKSANSPAHIHTVPELVKAVNKAMTGVVEELK
jgi:hypothetical protein